MIDEQSPREIEDARIVVDERRVRRALALIEIYRREDGPDGARERDVLEYLVRGKAREEY